jgi:hypothetical protein
MLNRPSLLIKIEEATILMASLALYNHLHASWLLFAILFLTPDLFMLGYLINPGIGSATYNLAHTLILPVTLALIAYTTHHELLTAIAIIWITHIALDRLLGYGLKYPTFFKDTHLQHIP